MTRGDRGVEKMYESAAELKPDLQRVDKEAITVASIVGWFFWFFSVNVKVFDMISYSPTAEYLLS